MFLLVASISNCFSVCWSFCRSIFALVFFIKSFLSASCRDLLIIVSSWDLVGRKNNQTCSQTHLLFFHTSCRVSFRHHLYHLSVCVYRLLVFCLYPMLVRHHSWNTTSHVISVVVPTLSSWFSFDYQTSPRHICGTYKDALVLRVLKTP